MLAVVAGTERMRKAFEVEEGMKKMSLLISRERLPSAGPSSLHGCLLQTRDLP